MNTIILTMHSVSWYVVLCWHMGPSLCTFNSWLLT